MEKITQADLVQAIKSLKAYTKEPLRYPGSNSWLVIHSIQEPHGPISIKTLDYPDQNPATKKPRSISANNIATIAHALRPYFPVDVEVLFHASGNTRSALETLLLYTPNMFLCYPGRTDVYTGEIREGVKHIM
jgi:hypothetical protein